MGRLGVRPASMEESHFSVEWQVPPSTVGACAPLTGHVHPVPPFPQLAIGFSDPRVTLHICDGIKFVEDSPADHYDVIIVDSSDPVGPAEVLFEKVRGGGGRLEGRRVEQSVANWLGWGRLSRVAVGRRWPVG